MVRSLLSHKGYVNLVGQCGRTVTSENISSDTVATRAKVNLVVPLPSFTKPPNNSPVLGPLATCTLCKHAYESEIEAGLGGHIGKFLLELGVGFSFVGSAPLDIYLPS